MSTTSFTTGQATSTSRVSVRARGQLLAATGAGVVFGFGLSLSTMIQPRVVLDFLTLQDFGLMLVLGGAVLVTFVAYRLLPRWRTTPLLGGVFGRHESIMDRQTIIGAAIFGIGWGICGVCPGPAIAGLGAGSWELLYAIAGIALGALVQGLTTK
jgi:uncharacterized membrane protein YedE/YeeE